MTLVLNSLRRNAGTWTTTFSPSIPTGTLVQVSVVLDPADAQDPALIISYVVETPDGRHLIEGQWRGGIRVAPNGAQFWSQPTEVITWPFPDSQPIRGSITINKRLLFGVDVTLL